MDYPAITTDNLWQRIAGLESRLEDARTPAPFTLISDVAKVDHAIMIDAIELLLEVVEGSAVVGAICALEKKVGINGSEDPDSIDYSVSQIEQKITPPPYHD